MLEEITAVGECVVTFGYDQIHFQKLKPEYLCCEVGWAGPLAQEMGDFISTVVSLRKSDGNMSISLWVEIWSFPPIKNCAFTLCSVWLKLPLYMHHIFAY